MWLSQATFGGLYKNSAGIPLKMDVGTDPRNMGTFGGDGQWELLIDGKKQKIVESMAKEIVNGKPSGDDYFTFSNSSKMPIIIRMQNGFYIGLKEIKTK